MGLKEMSAIISKSVQQMMEETKILEKEKSEDMEKVIEFLQSPAARTDRSENAAFDEAISDMNRLSVEMFKVKNRLAAIASIDDSKYTPLGFITLYSTFKIKYQWRDVVAEHVYKLYPEGVCDLQRHIISKDSSVGTSVWKKKKGETFKLLHQSTGEPITYEIIDVY